MSNNTPVEKYPPGTKVECLVFVDDQFAFIESGTYQGFDQVKWLWGGISHKIVLDSGDVLYDPECIYGAPGAFDAYDATKGKTRRRFRVNRDERGVYRGFTAVDLEGPAPVSEEPPKEEPAAPAVLEETTPAPETKGFLGKLFAK